jgi:hypothetical protein
MARQAATRSNPALRLAALRQVHVYVAALIAPSVLFFALTGSLQLFGLHEAHGAYRPLPVVEKLGMLHKDQVFAAKPQRPEPPASAKRAAAPKPDAPAKPAVGLLKAFFLLVAAGLVVTTGLGLWMGLSYNKNKGVVLALVVVGAIIPLVLAAFT